MLPLEGERRFLLALGVVLHKVLVVGLIRNNTTARDGWSDSGADVSRRCSGPRASASETPLPHGSSGRMHHEPGKCQPPVAVRRCVGEQFTKLLASDRQPLRRSGCPCKCDIVVGCLQMS